MVSNISLEDLTEYYRLGELFRAGEITPEEHEKLLELNDQVELVHADRVKELVEWAKRHNRSLEEAIFELGIGQK